MKYLFQHSEEQPYHISVGVVLVNIDGNICVHHYTKENVPARYQASLGGLSETRILMRESLENNETLEQACLRGIFEEFGAEGEIRRYLGAIQVDVNATLRTFEKTTLYFHVQCTKLGERPLDDEESFSTLQWVEPHTLIGYMKEQGARATRPDLDESKIIETYVTHR